MSTRRKKYSIGRQVIAFLLIGTIFLQLTGLDAYAAETRAGGSVTRLEWLKSLTETFGFSVTEDNYPDNYYSDVSSSSADYYDIMLATEFGLVDVEAGEALRPNDAATREFAAHTLNLCMGYVLENENYTFSESETASYPEDIQIAVNQGWFALSNGNFLPEQAVTQEEKAAMLAAAQEVLAGDENRPGDNTYTFKDSVLVLPENTEIESIDENTISIADCPAEITEGSIFGCVYDGVPLAWKAEAVRKEGENTIITIGGVNAEEVFEEISVTQERKIDLSELQPASEDAVMSYVVGGTEENNYEDGTVCHGLEEVGGREVTAVLVEQTADIPKAYAASRAAIPKIKATAKITNATQQHNVSLSNTYIDFDFKVDFNCNVSVDILEAAGISPSYELFYAPIIPGVYVKGVVDLSFYGEVNARLVEDVHLGFHYENFAARVTRRFKKDSFTVTANATANAGLRLEAGFNIPGLNGKIFGKVGANITAKSVHYTDGAAPATCQTLSTYIYASVGYDVTIDLAVRKIPLASDHKDIYTKYNSPVRTAFHYEDGKAVPRCTRGTPGMGYGGWGYFSPVNSQYYYAGGSSGGTYESGEVYTIFNYSLNGENQAVITGYQGTAVNVFIPETLDGYPVVGIAQNAFKNNTRIKSVSIADSVETIGRSAFSGCTALERVTLPENEKFQMINAYAFYRCGRLLEIEIPYSITEIGEGSFESCSEINKITIPNTVTIINNDAFCRCTKLKNITLSENLIKIGESAFNLCKELVEIELPDSVIRIEDWAFAGCLKLSKVKLSKKLEWLGAAAFGNCDKLTDIKIPKSLKACDCMHNLDTYYVGGPFYDCDGLKNITFEDGATEVASHLFDNCPGLEEIDIPDTITIIEDSAFIKCTKLKKVILSENLTQIENNVFDLCTKLTEIDIPDSVLQIEDRAFGGCQELSSVKLSKKLESLGTAAFSNCDKLVSIEIPKSLKYCDNWYNTQYVGGPFCFCDGLKEVLFESGTIMVTSCLFDYCYGIENIDLPDTITAIGSEAFSHCTNLKQVKFSANLNSIGSSAFSGCRSLEIAQIPEGVTRIGTGAFSGCSLLKKVKLPDQTTELAYRVFSSCTNLKEINLPDTLTAIRDNAFYNCDALTELEFPAQLTTIEANAFNDCDALTKVTIPDTVTQMGANVFYHCDSLADVSLGTGLISLPTYAFAQCPKLTDIILPYRMTTLNANAFNACTGLTEITMPRSLTSIGSQVFSYPGKMTIYGINGTYAQTYAEDNGITFVNREVNAEDVKISQTDLKIGKGQNRQLFLTVTPQNFTDEVAWKSGNTDIATVTTDGAVRGISCGTTNIKVTVGNVSSSCNVTVYQPITSIRLNKSSAALAAGDTLALTASVYPNDATDPRYNWSSTNPSIASVNENGVVTALAKGEATITAAASDGSGVTARCTISVTTEMITVPDVSNLQSPHPYENNCSDSWLYKVEGASGIAVTFSEKTEVEDGFDYIYLYDKNNALVGTYTGKELAGKTISVTGDTIRIKLETDNGGTAYGFEVESVTKEAHEGGSSGNGEHVSGGTPGGTPRPAVQKPTVSKVKSFKAKAGKKKLTLSWKALSDAEGYQIQIGTKKNFKGAKTISVSKSKKKYVKKGLKFRKKYYLRIRAYKTFKNAAGTVEKVYGSWSKTSKKVK